jgi:hypothetical protein
MQRLEVSGAVRHIQYIYVVRWLKVNKHNTNKQKSTDLQKPKSHPKSLGSRRMIMCHHMKFRSLSDLVPGICAPLTLTFRNRASHI